MIQRNQRRVAVGAALTMLAVTLAAPASADNGTDTGALRDAVTIDGVVDHLEALQTIAGANGGTRAAGTPGYEASAAYVENQLQAAGYTTTRQYFQYERVGTAVMDQLAPGAVSFSYLVDFYDMSGAGEGDVTAAVTAVDVNLAGDRASSSGCEAADFAGFPVGNIALVQRGTCSFRVKGENALAAGASALIVFNQGNVDPDDDRFGLFGGTFGEPALALPAVTATYAVGEQLAGTPGLVMRLALAMETVTTFNVLADTGGRSDRTVVVGGHLDGVREGPGINDNGSGIAAILETAIQIKALGITPRNRIRFAFWSGEEDGLIGSSYYVSQLTARQIKQHALNLNFDMLGSPNAARFVYDGDGDAFGTTGPNGSAVVEDVFLDYFAGAGLATEPTAFDGRSDYFAFIENGIPAGGLFSGAEDINPDNGIAYDPCYHQACDTINNISTVVLDQMADAVAHASLTFGMTTSAVNGTAKGQGTGSADFERKGDRFLR